MVGCGKGGLVEIVQVQYIVVVYQLVVCKVWVVLVGGMVVQGVFILVVYFVIFGCGDGNVVVIGGVQCGIVVVVV